jgi:hypothetical protein
MHPSPIGPNASVCGYLIQEVLREDYAVNSGALSQDLRSTWPILLLLVACRIDYHSHISLNSSEVYQIGHYDVYPCQSC